MDLLCPALHQPWVRYVPDGDWQPRPDTGNPSPIACAIPGFGPACDHYTSSWQAKPWVAYYEQCREYTQAGPGAFFGEPIGPLLRPVPEPAHGLLAGLFLVAVLARGRRK